MTGRFRILTLLGMLLVIVTGGTVFFHFVEGWGWIDAYFFTVVTISTVGYGKLVPVTVIGKIGTTVLIFFGLGVFAVAVQQIAMVALEKRDVQVDRLVRRGQKNDKNGRK